MTNPIPGADSERAAFEAAMNDRRFFPRELNFAMGKSPSGRDEYANPHLESCWIGWQARAAAKVGANVAAGIPRRATDEEIAAWVKRYDLGNILKGDARSAFEDAETLHQTYAAGAPAETPRGVIPASVDLDAPGEVNEKLLAYLNSASQSAPAETPKPPIGTPEGMRAYGKEYSKGYAAGKKAAAQPAPIAGDVEKDAARYRWLVEKFGQTQLPCFLEDKLSHGYIADGKTSIDTAIDAAAMLANSSSGEAG